MYNSFYIGYVYSFISAGVFYYILNHFFPAPESMVEFAITGEDIIAAQDAKNLERKQGGFSSKESA
jgi:NCS1 family nucleobase:cation symporter-1